MKKISAFLALTLAGLTAYGQKVVFDKGHLEIVNSNAATRLASELAYQASIEQIRKNTDNIGLNLTSVSLVENMVYRSLTNINGALKNAIQVKQMGYLINDIYKYTGQAVSLARGDPALLLFAEDATQQLKQRGIAMVADVSGYVLQNKDDILMNYNVRDELIRKVITELQIINALAYGLQQNMYWAKTRGFIKSINPYAEYVNKDFSTIDEILSKRQMIK